MAAVNFGYPFPPTALVWMPYSTTFSRDKAFANQVQPTNLAVCHGPRPVSV